MLVSDPRILSVLNHISRIGGTPIFVGGCVRDYLLGKTPKDVDIEIHGLNIDTIIEVLSLYGKCDLVGKSFGVIKFGGYDISIPRRENKVGVGHKDFTVETDKDIGIEEAFSRRDFTINAIGMGLDGNIIDPFCGVADLSCGILERTSDKFSEDPLRVLRGMQFCARFNLRATPETLRECRKIVREYKHLPKERVWGEWEKWAKSPYPSKGIEFLRASGWLTNYPELNDMVSSRQSREHHMEGSVYTHTLMVLEQIGLSNNPNKEVLTFAALLHDCGKPATFEETVDGKITNYGHESVGSEIARYFLSQIGCPDKMADEICTLIENHMFRGTSDKAIRRLSTRTKIADLAELIKADYLGRIPNGNLAYPNMLVERAQALSVLSEKPIPIVTGKKLLEMGVEPGPEMGRIIKRCYDSQLEGVLTSENWQSFISPV